MTDDNTNAPAPKSPEDLAAEIQDLRARIHKLRSTVPEDAIAKYQGAAYLMRVIGDVEKAEAIEKLLRSLKDADADPVLDAFQLAQRHYEIGAMLLDELGCKQSATKTRQIKEVFRSHFSTGLAAGHENLRAKVEALDIELRAVQAIEVAALTAELAARVKAQMARPRGSDH
jgi:hypothetical protein